MQVVLSRFAERSRLDYHSAQLLASDGVSPRLHASKIKKMQSPLRQDIPGK